MQSAPTNPTFAVIKRLFAVSGNRCAFPKCENHLVQEGVVIGEVCHIRAASDNGPRADRDLSLAERHGYENLILLCANHHKVIDDDQEAYTVDRLEKMKIDHERSCSAQPDENVEEGARLIVGQLVSSRGQAGGITAHTVYQTFNVHAPNAGTPDETSRRRNEARRVLAPELQRTIERVLYIHSRAMVNFICHSAENGAEPGDKKQDFIPYWPSLYPHAPQVRDLEKDDVVLLAAFYDSLTSLNDEVSNWWEREGQLPVNLFNSFLHGASKSLRLALACVEKFGSELFPQEYESWGSLVDRIRKVLAAEESAREHHLKRFQAKQGLTKAQLRTSRSTPPPSYSPFGPRKK